MRTNKACRASTTRSLLVLTVAWFLNCFIAAFSRLADSEGSDSDACSDDFDSSSDDSAKEEWDASSFLGALASVVATPVQSFCVSDNTH